ncbi:MAG: pirin family protein [Burkholderiaceae bacterium]
MTRSREVEKVLSGQATSDGAGVRLTRMFGADLQRRLDPFLMLDAFRSDNPGDYIAGFPEHPHRGFETVTVMLAGRMRHRDSRGNEGLLAPGDVQWMTAGRGILHSEMPEQQDGLLEGFQLWLNLPARDKMREPDYHDIQAGTIPVVTPAPSVSARVIAGRLDVSPGGAVAGRGVIERDATQPLLVDLRCQAGAEWSVPIPVGHNAFIQVYRGELLVGARSRAVAAGKMALLDSADDADRVEIRATESAAAIVVAGRPLNEPIAQYGPFVMNTREELMTAVADLRAGQFG